MKLLSKKEWLYTQKLWAWERAGLVEREVGNASGYREHSVAKREDVSENDLKYTSNS